MSSKQEAIGPVCFAREDTASQTLRLHPIHNSRSLSEQATRVKLALTYRMLRSPTRATLPCWHGSVCSFQRAGKRKDVRVQSGLPERFSNHRNEFDCNSGHTRSVSIEFSASVHNPLVLCSTCARNRELCQWPARMCTDNALATLFTAPFNLYQSSFKITELNFIRLRTSRARGLLELSHNRTDGQ